MDSTGILFAMASAACWGSFFVPVRKVGIKNVWQLQGATGIGVFLLSIPMSIFWGFDILPSGLLSGAIWTIANILALYSVRLIGLSRTSSFLAGFSILVSFLWGVLFFHESFEYLILAVVAVGLLLGGLPFISSTSKDFPVKRKGYLVATCAGLIGGSYVVPMLATNTLQSGFFSSSLSIFAISMPLLLFSKRFIKREVMAGILSGGLFNLGSLTVLVAVGLIGITVAFPISQTATVFGVSWGILYFKEIIKRRNILKVVAGVGLIMCGAVLLTIA